MDLSWVLFNYAWRIGLPVLAYRLARVDNNSAKSSLGAAGLAAFFCGYADLNVWEQAYLDGPLASAIGVALAAKTRNSIWPFKNLETIATLPQ